jgi:hypothetical protein
MRAAAGRLWMIQLRPLRIRHQVHGIQYFENPRIGDRVKNIPAIPAVLDEAIFAQDRKLL